MASSVLLRAAAPPCCAGRWGDNKDPEDLAPASLQDHDIFMGELRVTQVKSLEDGPQYGTALASAPCMVEPASCGRPDQGGSLNSEEG